MYRYLPAVAAVVLVASVLALATTSAFDDATSGPPPVVVSEDPVPSCFMDPCPRNPLPEDYPSNPQPPIEINGQEIPAPEGASLGLVPLPSGTLHMFLLGQSVITFSREGWIGTLSIEANDEEDFSATLDALYAASNPVVVNGKSFRVPRGATYNPPAFEVLPSGFVGPADEWPIYHVIKLGESVISLDTNGRVVAERIEAEDADELRSVADATRD